MTEESVPVPAATVTLVEGASFAICGSGGDIAGSGVEGLFVGDTRVCSRLLLTIDGRPVETLAVAARSPFAASFVGRTADRGLLVFRDLWVGRGARLDIHLRNLTGEPRSLALCVDLEADLAELFAVKSGRTEPLPATASAADGVLSIVAEEGRRGLIVRGAGAVAAADGSLRWRADVAAGAEWSTCVQLAAVRGGEELAPRHRCGASPHESVPSARLAGWERRLPRIASDVPGLAPAIERTGEDLGALRIFDPDHPDEPVIAAGAPWYMTLFGRDSILTAWMALLIEPRLGLGVARALARLQGRGDDPESEEQPGRILHEVRFSRGPSLALGRGEVYYGTVDATPLFVMLVHELWRWGVPLAEIRPLLPAVDAALAWVAGPGDADGDGYVEYLRRSPRGLVNQGWKDSHDGISFADGRLPEPPIALAEVQGYAYAAWRAGAALAAATDDTAASAERNRRADDLRARFDADFWMPDRAAYALALDRDKRQVDAVASNMGHCLWTGIVTDRDKAAAVARWLTSPELFTGWGVRTLAGSMARYSPLSYHNGSVWPHDTAICMAGLRRLGFVEEALEVATGLLAAADRSGGRLPELFAGLTDREVPVPVRYPASCSPQAWASAAPLLVVRALLGLEPDVPAGRIQLDPVLPAGAARLGITDLPLGEGRMDVHADEGAVAVGNVPTGLAIVRPAH
jgi:glycogen debranching enzyme